MAAQAVKLQQLGSGNVTDLAGRAAASPLGEQAGHTASLATVGPDVQQRSLLQQAWQAPPAGAAPIYPILVIYSANTGEASGSDIPVFLGSFTIRAASNPPVGSTCCIQCVYLLDQDPKDHGPPY